ncbi:MULTISPECIES: amidase [Streptomyces]|uniref:amidase n=1 Tax=Streptomyces TaxID=1883 RepID=UPI000B9E457F|nr:amidase [Streptomyces kasugaensis]
MAELHDLTLLEQAAAIRERSVSPVALTTHYLERIQRLNAGLGAYAQVDAEGATAAAEAAERRIAAGGEGAGELPPLLGVPVSVKDTWPVAGLRCTAGSAAFADRVAPQDAAAVAALRASGAVILGMTTAAELGCSSYTETHAGNAVTPYDPTRGAGGSSGGAASGLAAGLSAGAFGSDGGGSVRIPAAFCGVVGLKVTRGRISPEPGGDPAGLTGPGPLGRTVHDTAALLDAMACTVPGDPYPAPTAPGTTFARYAERAPGRLRVGVLPDGAGDDLQCRAGSAAAAKLLSELGHEVVQAPATGTDEYADAFKVVWAMLATGVAVPAEREGRLLPLTRWLRETGRGYRATEFLAALTELRQLARRIEQRYSAYDVVLSPTSAVPAPPLGATRDDDDPAAGFARMLDVHPATPLWNITGRPAISLPLHWTPPTPEAPAGLPVGIMLAGRYGADGPLLSLAAQLESASPWIRRHPPVW